jgi:DNA-directed RNA polymerase
VGEAPLDQLDLWREASDPWQFVQLAKAIADCMEGDRESGVPIRFDQTCSGLGILASLTRDRQLARLTNVIGECREDLYTHIAAQLMNLLRMDLESYDLRDASLAEKWLGMGIARDLTKGPVMTTVYGARFFGVAEGLVAYLQDKSPDVPVAYWQREYTRPAQYLARKLNLVIAAELKSCVATEKWLRQVSQRCMKKQQRIRWVSPMGFPISLGTEVDREQPVRNTLHRNQRWTHIDGHFEPGMLSAKATNRGITANFIHTFDAAHCHAVVSRCAQVGVQVLTNHDCFAVAPAHADWLHHTVIDEFRTLYRPDWLAELRVEIGRNAKLQLPHPPHVGDLCEGEIGNNPYLFC